MIATAPQKHRTETAQLVSPVLVPLSFPRMPTCDGCTRKVAFSSSRLHVRVKELRDLLWSQTWTLLDCSVDTNCVPWTIWAQADCGFCGGRLAQVWYRVRHNCTTILQQSVRLCSVVLLLGTLTSVFRAHRTFGTSCLAC